MSYYRAKRELEREEAKRYLAEREAADRIRPVDERLQRSRVWLDKYLAPDRKRPTGVNWAPRWPVKPPGDDNGKEIIEGDYSVVADHDAASEVDRENMAEVAGGGEAAGRRLEAPSENPQADFSDQDRTPF
jgi:hypothetical protein